MEERIHLPFNCTRTKETIAKNTKYCDTKQSDIAQPLTKVLLQLGLDLVTIISSAYPGFISGGRNSAGH
jgi:hypothetical protein